MSGVRLISSLRAPPLPPRRPPRSEQVQSPKVEGDGAFPVDTSRRSASLSLLSLAAFPALAISEWCPPAAAFSLGISGPKEWLRDQKKNAARFVWLPSMPHAEAFSLPTSCFVSIIAITMDPESRLEDPGQVRKLLNSAARDCVAEDRGSIVAFQARTGVEVCTFRLILTNASSLLDKYDPIKLEAEAKLDTLIRSFTLLGKMIDDADLQLDSNRQRVKVGLNDTIFALGKFEESIKDCLGV
ncbi:unnamed protein product [Spirodela intermedia]|uniref:Uncharacterized protein n=1 Tax=Spirodela intermedia TaxID=51605 RepID=A0A7I8IKT2_SPIIN|nr:unnamed protein product [Spirodela intermedia]CAA6657607.1 unnamed protein product [Spirodela intermedia]